MSARHLGSRPNPTSTARLQLVLILLAAWDGLGFVLTLTNSALLKVNGIDGALGARSVSGSLIVLAAAYVYAARAPLRYRFVLWMASLEQFFAMFSYTFHWARADVGFGETIIPLLVSAAFLVALLTTLSSQGDARA